MAEVELINDTELEFIDISSEEWRIYIWESKEGSDYSDEYVIDKPQWLAITKSGHRILDIHLVSHFIPYGWRMLKWSGNPHFVR